MFCSALLSLMWVFHADSSPAQRADTNATWYYVSATTNLTGDNEVDFPDLAVPEPAVMTFVSAMLGGLLLRNRAR